MSCWIVTIKGHFVMLNVMCVETNKEIEMNGTYVFPW